MPIPSLYVNKRIFSVFSVGHTKSDVSVQYKLMNKTNELCFTYSLRAKYKVFIYHMIKYIWKQILMHCIYNLILFRLIMLKFKYNFFLCHILLCKINLMLLCLYAQNDVDLLDVKSQQIHSCYWRCRWQVFKCLCTNFSPYWFEIRRDHLLLNNFILTR